MAALGFWGWVKLLIRLAPEIIAIVKKCVVWVDGQIDLAQTRTKMREFVEGADKAIDTGDTSDVEAIFNPRP